MSSGADVAARGRPLAWSILALVAASVLLATLVLFAVTFSGPPPRDGPVPLDDLAAALRTRGVATYRVVDRAPPPFPGRPPFDGPPPPDHFGGPPKPQPQLLYLSRSASEPQPRRGESARAEAAALLAEELGTTADRVRVYAGPQLPGLRRILVGGLTAAVREEGGWAVARTRDRPLLSRWHLVTLGAMAATLLALSSAAWAISRAVARPLGRLADAALRARAGAERPEFPTGGPAEVRALSTAVSDMHDRLQRHAEGRTAMLAAIAHDLGTPLSRLAFRVEMLPEAERQRAAADVDEMRAMIAAAIGFARADATERETVRVDLGSLIDSLAEDMRSAGDDVTVEPGPRTVVMGDPAALRRLFANLIGNAVRYGTRARVGWTRQDGRAVVRVEDDGSGIDPAQADRLFEPFVRGDPSRNRATGGTGLGLAIVRSIAERHGGSAMLANGATGAVATVILPA